MLGASSGFGAATARALGRHGMGIVGVHLDRKATLPLAEAVADDVRAAGAAGALLQRQRGRRREARAGVRPHARSSPGESQLRVLMHSLAFGTLQALRRDAGRAADDEGAARDDARRDGAQPRVLGAGPASCAGSLGEGSRVFAMTSSGGTRVMPFYGAVSAAKAALESHVRQLALELGRRGVAVNAIRAGVTDTPAVAQDPDRGDALAGGAAPESRRAAHEPGRRGRRDRRAVAARDRAGSAGT